MSAETSTNDGKPYGVARVCRVFETPKSTFYSRLKPVEASADAVRQKPGPKTPMSDVQLLELIRKDLAESCFVGEGHRKVWARLRHERGICVGAKRILRIMRENKLLSPHRARQGSKNPHDGTIITEKPNDMWGTDGMMVQTVTDGWVWVFTVVEHWNAECVGFHVSKDGSRFSALEPILQGIRRHFGKPVPGVARGLTVRPDHGSQFTSHHYKAQLESWGIALSFAYVKQPQTNGVTERFNRTLREQVVHGRVYTNVGELREAIARFVPLYNSKWRVEKLGYMTPLEAREGYGQQSAA